MRKGKGDEWIEAGEHCHSLTRGRIVEVRDSHGVVVESVPCKGLNIASALMACTRMRISLQAVVRDHSRLRRQGWFK